ncbi:unnamed protein product [Dicrocoelium dendriticum]|nr:unnamed protein product [Dicrocoelium dendriticum]
MTAAISRHTSTISLASPAPVHVDAGFLVQCLGRHKELLEAGCERVLYSKCCEISKNGAISVNSDEVLQNSACSGSASAHASRSTLKGPSAAIPTRRLDKKARETLGQHLIELLATIVLPEPPQSISEVEAKLVDGLPSIPDKMLPTDADVEALRLIATKKRKNAVLLPVKEIHSAFKEFNERFSFTVSIYIAAVAEHIIGNFLMAAICFEEEALTGNVIRASTVETLFTMYRDRLRSRRKPFELRLANRFPQDYDKCVDELEDFLHATVEQMNLILRVFREPVLMSGTDDHQSPEENAVVIFGSILDLYNNLRIFLDTLSAEEEDMCSPVIECIDSCADELSPKQNSLPDHQCAEATSMTQSSEAVTGNLMEPLHTQRPSATRCRFRRRLVGICLIELAEDDSLHEFGQYATSALDYFSRDRIWALAENSGVLQELCRLSRTILQMASLNKPPGATCPTCPVGAASRWFAPHSFQCTQCRLWDSVPSSRRRSASSCVLRLSNGSSPVRDGSFTTPEFFSGHAKTWRRPHRVSKSPSVLENSTDSASCNFVVIAFRYLLPRLLLLPIFQFFYLHELIKTLHDCAYDEYDRARLHEVLSMLRKTRSGLERDLSKNPWVCLHLSRLISTGHLAGQYRALYMDLLAGSSLPASPGAQPSSPSDTTSTAGGSPSSMTSVVGSQTQTFKYPSTAVDSTEFCAQCSKAEEIERLLGGKVKLATLTNGRQNLGDFVMEGRVQVSTEFKRWTTEHVAYLFTGFLLICKWQERRSALTPNSAPTALLRLKHRIPLDLIHLTDLCPIVQPNLPSYLGNHGTLTSSAVGAAVLAASGSCHSSVHDILGTSLSNMDLSNPTMVSNLVASGLNGPLASQSNLHSASASAYSYTFRLEYVDCPQPVGNLTPPTSAQCHHNVRNPSPQKHITKCGRCGLGCTDPTFQELDVVSTSCLAPYNDPSGTHAGPPSHHIILALRTPEEKADWIASLSSIQLHRQLLRYIRTLPKIEIPLRLPCPTIYRFAQPDTADNIIFEATLDSSADVHDSYTSSEDGFEEDDCVGVDSEDFMSDIASTCDSLDEKTSPVCRMRDSVATAACKSTVKLSGTYLDDGSDSATLTSSVTLKSIPANLNMRATAEEPMVNTNLLNRSCPTVSRFPLLIRMATLEKLVERLAYPTHFDTRLVNTFLLVYRRVTTPENLLDLLIERFRIPDPEFSPDELECDPQKGQLESPAQHMLKRFRSGYKKRVQARVLMVLSRWVRSSRYYQSDFAPSPELRHKLTEFLATVQSRHLSSVVRRIQQHLQAHSVDDNSDLEQSASHATDEVSVNSCIPSSKYLSRTGSHSAFLAEEEVQSSASPLDLTGVHPYKLAEQVTLYEWELYRAIQFWEVDGRDRTGRSTPNLDKSKQFSNRFRNWLVYAILMEQHPEDRMIAIQRVIDLMLIMEKMNNLQGSQEAKSALISASVFRLRKSFQSIRRMRHYRDVVDRLLRENSTGSKLRTKISSVRPHSPNANDNDHPSGSISPFVFGLPFSTKVSKAHERRIRVLEKQHASGDACHPCVPFIAVGVMTRLIHLDLRHPDTVTTESGTVLVNYWKLRQLAEVVERYMAFQRIPYMFKVDNELRVQLENLNPLELTGCSSEAQFETRMYELSETYEPRETDATPDSAGPTLSVDRRLSKEAIQAANLLSSVSLKERMSFQSKFSFTDILSTRVNPSVPSRSSLLSHSTNFGGYKGGLKNMHNTISSSHTKSIATSRDTDVVGSTGSAHHFPCKFLSTPIGTTDNPTVTEALSTWDTAHQHSMSDSQVLSASKQTVSQIGSPSISAQRYHHEAAHSIHDMFGLRDLGLFPPISSLTSSQVSLAGLPPPLPPRKPQHVGSSGNGSTISPSSQSGVSAMPSTKRALFSAKNYPSHDSSSAVPPPLPPKMPSRSLSSQLSRLHASTPSPHPFTNDQAFTFTAENHTYIESLTAELPPPLPPRRAVTPTVSALGCGVRPLIPPS